MSSRKTSNLFRFAVSLGMTVAGPLGAGCSKKSPQALAAECSEAASCVSDAACKTACTEAAACPKPGGPVAGPVDTHCTAPTVVKQATDPAVCESKAATLAWAPRHHDGNDDDDIMPAMDVHNALYNSEGDDDDCKYHVAFSTTSVCLNDDVYFVVHATKRADDKPLTGANPYVELYRTEDTSLPASIAASTREGPDGTYTMGPYRMPKSGLWTARFHFYGNCDDTQPTSPHGHVAFFVDVP